MTGGMMFKGTPGPWTYDKEDGEVYSKGAYTSVAMALGGDAGDDNGYLIAAAPELLEIVMRLANGERSDEGYTAIREVAIAAIAKALGEQK